MTDRAMVHVDESGPASLHAREGVPRGCPEPCAGRSKETCAGGGCSLGQCVGTGNCDSAGDEYVCRLYEDCSWEPDTCVGKADESCELADYAQGVPGWRDPERHSGLRGYRQRPARASPLVTRRVGASGRPVSAESRTAERGTRGIPGCVCSGSACEGTFQCSDVGTSADCVKRWQRRRRLVAGENKRVSEPPPPATSSRPISARRRRVARCRPSEEERARLITAEGWLMVVPHPPERGRGKPD